MTIQLKPEQERIIQEEIQNGHFNNPDEVLDYALAALREKHRCPESLVQFFRDSPFVGMEVEFKRRDDTGAEDRFMNGFLLDTNVVSELFSLKPNQQVVDWMNSADENRLYLSAITLGEIRQGVALLPQSQKRTRLESWLEVDLQLRFAGRILIIDRAVADRWGLIMAHAQAKGRTLPVVDGLIAATALHHNLTAVTRNVRDFKTAGLIVFNPWEF